MFSSALMVRGRRSFVRAIRSLRLWSLFLLPERHDLRNVFSDSGWVDGVCGNWVIGAGNKQMNVPVSGTNCLDGAGAKLV